MWDLVLWPRIENPGPLYWKHRVLASGPPGKSLHCRFMLFSHWVVSDSLQPHGLQPARLLCPPLSPGVCSNSCPLSRWRYLTISCSVTPFSFCPQSFPASGSFPVNWLLTKMAEVLMLQHRCLLWTFQVDFFKDSLFWSCSQGALKSLLQHHSMKVSILGHSAFFMVQLSHLYTATG